MKKEPMINDIYKQLEEEFDEKFGGESELSGAILSALEYRGFYDAGKYLDDDISEKISPIIKSFLKSSIIKVLEGIVEREESKRRKIPPNDYETTSLEEAINIGARVGNNNCINDTISYLKSEIDKLKK